MSFIVIARREIPPLPKAFGRVARNDKIKIMSEAKLEKIAKIFLWLAPLLPLIFIKGFYFPFIITKVVYFRLLIQLALTGYLLLLLVNFKKYRPTLTPALVLAIIFLAANTLAAILGLDVYRSFWSNFERLEGVSGLVYLVIYLFLLLALFKTKKDWLVSIRIILVTSLLVSLYGLIQKFGLLPVFEAGINRIASTIGNAAFLAGFLLLAIGLGLYYFTQEKNKKYKNFTLLIVAIDLIVLLLTSTRGAILGLVAGGLVFLILSSVFSQANLKKSCQIALAALLLMVMVFYFSRPILASSRVEFIRRMATISLADPTINNRLLVWQMAVMEFKNRPFFGAGLENFEAVFNQYFSPKITENWFDRTHNIYLDQLVSAGLAGLLAYLAILFYLFYLLAKKRKADYFFFSILTSLLAAYGLHNFFVFDSINTVVVYFFLIGLISFKQTEDQSEQNQEPAPREKNQAVFYLAGLGLLIVNCYLFYQLIYLPIKINRNLFVGYYYILYDSNRSYESFKTALSYKLGAVETACQLNKMYEVLSEEKGAEKELVEKFYRLNKEKLKFASEAYPLDIKTKLYLAQLIINEEKSQAELDQAESLLQKSVELSPGRPEPYYLLYNLYLIESEPAKAVAILEDLIRQLPWFGEAKIMLASKLQKDNPDKAEEYFQQGLKETKSFSASTLKKVIAYLLDGKRYGQTIEYYLQLIKVEPTRFDYRLDLAKVYYLTGQIDNAIEQINIINSYDSKALKGNEQFIQMLYQAYQKSL